MDFSEEQMTSVAEQLQQDEKSSDSEQYESAEEIQDKDKVYSLTSLLIVFNRQALEILFMRKNLLPKQRHHRPIHLLQKYYHILNHSPKLVPKSALLQNQVYALRYLQICRIWKNPNRSIRVENEIEI